MSFILTLFSRFQWFRRLIGGRWVLVDFDPPVCGAIWVGVPSNFNKPRGGALDEEDWGSTVISP